MLLNGKLLANEEAIFVSFADLFSHSAIKQRIIFIERGSSKLRRGLFIMNKLTITKSKKIILSAMLLSILLVLSRFFSIKSAFLVISFSFIPMMLAGIYLGPK